MKVKKNFLTAGVVLVSTIGTSHLMQSGGRTASVDTPAPITGVENTRAAVPIAMPKLDRSTLAVAGALQAGIVPVRLEDIDVSGGGPEAEETALAMPEMPPEAASPAALPMPGPSPHDRLAMTAADGSPDPVTVPVTVNEYGLTCGVILSAAERPAAMVNLSVTAPCHSGERITIRHGGLLYSAALDGLGMYSSQVPALTETAVFDVTFPDGTVETTDLVVAAADQIERVVLQFNGQTGLQIHALEFGADYGAPGHVWSGNARDADSALNMGGGYLTSLGDPALPDAFLAEVYTLPTNVTGRDGVVRLNVEAEISAANCSRTIAGETLQRAVSGEMSAVSLTLSMPNCDAIGEFLVLKNLLRDLKIATN